MNTADTERLDALGDRIAAHALRKGHSGNSDRGELQELRRALEGKSDRGLKGWLMKHQWERTLNLKVPGPEPLYDAVDHRLLFDGEDTWAARDYLTVVVVERLHRKLHAIAATDDGSIATEQEDLS